MKKETALNILVRHDSLVCLARKFLRHGVTIVMLILFTMYGFVYYANETIVVIMVLIYFILVYERTVLWLIHKAGKDKEVDAKLSKVINNLIILLTIVGLCMAFIPGFYGIVISMVVALGIVSLILILGIMYKSKQ